MKYLQFSSVKFRILQSGNYCLRLPSANSSRDFVFCNSLKATNPYFLGLQKIPQDKCHVMSKFRKLSPKEMEENQNKSKINTVNNLSL